MLIKNSNIKEKNLVSLFFRGFNKEHLLNFDKWLTYLL